jgi:hypothetical protein
MLPKKKATQLLPGGLSCVGPSLLVHREVDSNGMV